MHTCHDHYVLQESAIQKLYAYCLSEVLCPFFHLQLVQKFFKLKNVEYRDGIKSKEARQGGLCTCNAVR